jgi:hypothetical protein
MDPFQRDDFGRVMITLAETLREQVSDIAVEGYFSALRDVALADVAASADRLSRTSQWFPKPSEWRMAALHHKNEQVQKALPESRTEPWHSECPRCDDEGWVCSACSHIDCDKDAAAHDRRMRPCICRPSNKTYQRRNQHRGAA